MELKESMPLSKRESLILKTSSLTCKLEGVCKELVKLSLFGIILALCVLMFLIMRGVNIFLSAITAAVVVAVTGGLDIYTALKEDYILVLLPF